MAVLVYFERDPELPGGVCYSFGPDPAGMDRRLCMDTVTRSSEPLDGAVDHLFLQASRKINSLYEERGGWPERGMSAS